MSDKESEAARLARLEYKAAIAEGKSDEEARGISGIGSGKAVASDVRGLRAAKYPEDSAIVASTLSIPESDPDPDLVE